MLEYKGREPSADYHLKDMCLLQERAAEASLQNKFDHFHLSPPPPRPWSFNKLNVGTHVVNNVHEGNKQRRTVSQMEGRQWKSARRCDGLTCGVNTYRLGDQTADHRCCARGSSVIVQTFEVEAFPVCETRHLHRKRMNRLSDFLIKDTRPLSNINEVSFWGK